MTISTATYKLLSHVPDNKGYTGITNNRIHLIYGKNGREDVLHTCENPKAGKMADKPIPYGAFAGPMFIAPITSFGSMFVIL